MLQIAHTTARPTDILLPRLEGVIATGKGWRSQCPACGGKSRKVAIAEADNGSVLLHAFCGHSPAEVLDALGLTLADLFPTRDLRTLTPQQRRELRQNALLPKWRAALGVLAAEATVLQIAARKLGDGFALDDDELTRMRLSALRIFDAQAVLEARHG